MEVVPVSVEAAAASVGLEAGEAEVESEGLAAVEDSIVAS